MSVLKYIIEGTCIFFSVALTILIMFQTTKSEGLSGIIGGQSSTTLQTKVGIEKEIDRFTRWAAIGFFVTAFLSIFFFNQ